jgi:hypothetical protein
MTHHDMSDWIDYLRGVAEPARRAAMDAHLREGCRACEELLADLRTLAVALAADEALEPPAHVVRWARAVFTRVRPESVCALPRVLARLVHDSLAEPLPAGVRGGDPASRQALFEAGDTFVDLRVERRPGQAAVALVGQLLREHRGDGVGGGLAMDGRPVVLTADGTILAATASNEHGEFHFEYVPEGRMRLHIPVGDRLARIEIPLNGLTPGGKSRRRGAAPRRARTERHRR